MNADDYALDDFSISKGGPINYALLKLGLKMNQVKLLVAGLCFTWLPLVILTTIEGTLYSGSPLPFLDDIAMQARILLALPMLIMIKAPIDYKSIAVLKYITGALLSPEDRSTFLTTTLRKCRALTSSILTDIILLLIVIVATLSLVKSGVYSGLKIDTSSWMASMTNGQQSLSLAGKWTVFISIPIFQFVMLRWLWKYIIWIYLLFRLSQTRLKLMPTHSDRAGGLGIIILAQRSYSMIFMALSIVLSGQLIAQLLQEPDSVIVIRNVVIAYVVLSLFLIICPLLFFIGKLLKTKHQGLFHLSNLGAELSRKFEDDWISKKPIEERIEENPVDPSMLYDYESMYDLLQQFRIVPVTIRDVIGIGIPILLPFIPILFVLFSAGELFKKIIELMM